MSETSSATAWLAWVFVHLVFLMSFRNRVSVFLIWMYSYFTRDQGARLITPRAKEADG